MARPAGAVRIALVARSRSPRWWQLMAGSGFALVFSQRASCSAEPLSGLMYFGGAGRRSRPAAALPAQPVRSTADWGARPRPTTALPGALVARQSVRWIATATSRPATGGSSSSAGSSATSPSATSLYGASRNRQLVRRAPAAGLAAGATPDRSASRCCCRHQSLQSPVQRRDGYGHQSATCLPSLASRS